MPSNECDHVLPFESDDPMKMRPFEWKASLFVDH